MVARFSVKINPVLLIVIVILLKIIFSFFFTDYIGWELFASKSIFYEITTLDPSIYRVVDRFADLYSLNRIRDVLA